MKDPLDEQAQALYAGYFCFGPGAGDPGGECMRQHLSQFHRGEWRISYPPPLLRAGVLEQIGRVAAQLLQLVFSLPERLFAGNYRRMLQAQGLDEAQTDYLLAFCRPALLQRAQLFARPDAILSDSGFMLVEMNVTPSLGGLGICNRYADSFRHDALGRHLRQAGLRWHEPAINPRWARLMQAQCPRRDPSVPLLLLELLANAHEQPQDNFARADFHLMVRQAGFELLSGKPADLELTAHGVYCAGRRIDVVYTDFVYAEQRQYAVDPALPLQLEAAEAAGLIALISAPPACALFDNKVNLALLHDPQYAACFSAAEHALIRAHIPPSWRLSAASLDLARQRQRQLLLKPGLGLCGRNIVFGEQLSPQTWLTLLQGEIEQGHCWLLQQVIPDIWSYSLAHWNGARRMLCIGPMLLEGAYVGSFLREERFSGPVPLVNYAQGASWCAGLELATCPPG